MATATRQTKSFSLDRAVLKEIQRTRGSVSTSERVNELLKVGLEVERTRSLHSEAAAFFKEQPSDRKLHDAFHSAGIASMIRDED